MSFGPKRGHFLFIFKNVFKDFGFLIAILLFCFFTSNFGLLTDNLAIAFVAFMGPVSKLLAYLTTIYTIDNEVLYIKSGLFVKKNKEIPTKNITNIDVTQTLIYQFVNVYNLVIDTTASMDSSNGKIEMVLSAKDSQIVKKILLDKEDFNEEDLTDSKKVFNDMKESLDSHKVRVATFKEVAALGLLKIDVGMAIKIISFVGAAMPILTAVFKTVNLSEESFYETLIKQVSAMSFGFLIVLGFIVFSMIVSFVVNLIRYYEFRISDRGESFYVEYGLFTKKTHTLVKSKISGITFIQPPFMRMLKVGYLDVSAIGYGDGVDGKESMESLFFPLQKVDTLNKFLAEFKDTTILL